MLNKLKQFNLPELEEKILKFWKENNVFRKSVALRQAQGKKAKPFRFFEGPPTANGRPGIHHVLARSFKDVILRYKTMRGHFVLRRAGWDTHGLPVELEVEKKLGIKNKREIEKFGIAEFNTQAKMSVWAYKSEWERLTERIGFWLDFGNPYVTYENKYVESLWWVFSEISKRGFLKKLYKVIPWCPRCQTPLSSHELGQPGAYKLTKDPSVYVKFEIRNSKSLPRRQAGETRKKQKEFLLVWTTTPWTLPGNVAVAVNSKLTYTKYKIGDEYVWSYNVPPKLEGKEVEVVEKMSGQKLVGKEYEPTYPNKGEHKVIAADFVSTTEGTGLVHIAPAYGEDDLRVAGKGETPITIDDRGFMKKGLPGGGKFIKEADKDIISDLAKRKILYSSGTIEHEYPFCWRCSTPLIYFARVAWFLEMSRLREEMLKANQKINWIPEHIKEGRFGEWLRDIKDWAISRERYWGTPLPIWECGKCRHQKVVGSLDELGEKSYSQNNYFIMRHAESDHNLKDIIASGPENGKNVSKLTAKGRLQMEKSAQTLKREKPDLIICSPYARTRETAKIVSKITGAKVITDKRLEELNTGVFNGRPISEHRKFFSNRMESFTKAPAGGESLNDVKRRMMDFLKETDSQYQNKNIVIVSHGDPLWVLDGAVRGLSNEEILKQDYYLEVGKWSKLPFPNWPFNHDGEVDLHRPFVDEVYLRCSECGSKMERVKEVADVWFDSGAMPFAQWHYPFENKKLIDGGAQYPADYIAEGIDQTRGWFYTLLAVATLLKRDLPYRNVISLGLLLDKTGQKMSKSKGNVVDPWQMLQKYGADVLRWYFYTVNPPGEPKRFDENDLRKTLNKLFMLLYNSFVFYSTYGKEKHKPIKVLDEWIIDRLNATADMVTANLEVYAIGDAAQEIEALVDDLSRWYIRRSRKNVSGKTLRLVLSGIAKMMAPFAPFFAEALWLSLGNKDSVHLQDWTSMRSKSKVKSSKLLTAMAEVRRLASLALAEREKAGIKVRQPLRELRIKPCLPAGRNKELEKNKELLNLLADEVNIKEVVLDNKINGEIQLDTTLTPELRNEGILRELVRMVQGLRHDAKYQPHDKIILMMELPKELLKVVDANSRELKAAVNAKNVVFKKEKFDAELNTKLENAPVWIAVKKF